MKKAIIFLILISSIITVRAQDYQTKENINYYSDAISNSDSYIKSKCVLDVYYPSGSKNFGTIIWFHGGSLSAGKKEIPEALKNKGYAVIGVDYRLSPKVKAPVYIEIYISGHSAGGYLALMITLDKSYLNKYQIDANSIAAIIPLSGQAITHFTIRKENGIKTTQPIIDKYAPLYFVRADAPPMLLITGGRELELFGRYEENAYLDRMMKLCGHKSTTLYELQGYGHGMTEPAFPLLIEFVKKMSKQLAEAKK